MRGAGRGMGWGGVSVSHLQARRERQKPPPARLTALRPHRLPPHTQRGPRRHGRHQVRRQLLARAGHTGVGPLLFCASCGLGTMGAPSLPAACHLLALFYALFWPLPSCPPACPPAHRPLPTLQPNVSSWLPRRTATAMWCTWTPRPTREPGAGSGAACGAAGAACGAGGAACGAGGAACGAGGAACGAGGAACDGMSARAWLWLAQ